MNVNYRPITEDEFSNWRIAVRGGFNEQVHPDDITRLRNDRIEIDRLFGAFADGNNLVGTGGTDSYQLTVPGGAQIPAAGIAYIGTAATHLRRGILTGMMRTLLDQAIERKEPVATLWASQSGIYSRFGFGQATVAEGWSIKTANATFAHAPKVPGKTRFVSHDDALEIMPRVWETLRKNRTGFLDRSPSRWRYFFFDEERIRGGWSGMFHVVYEDNGIPEGYAAYRMKRLREEEFEVEMKVVEAVTSTPESHAAIWHFLLNVDLVQSVSAGNRPSSDALWWMLADPRQLKRTPSDGLWARVLDVETALAARTYESDGHITFEVIDNVVPAAAGIFRLTVSGGKATCERTSAQPEVTLGASELGSVYLGGTRLSHLARAGRAEKHVPGAIARFDWLFSTAIPPWCPHEF